MNIEALERKICKHLSLMSWVELREHGINGQQAVKIRNGEAVHFREKTRERLRKLVEKKN